MDVLSDVLGAVRLTGAIFFDIDASSPWVGESPGTREIAAAIMPRAEHIISFHAVLSGGCWATLGDESVPWTRIDEGDIVVFPGGSPNVLSSSPAVRGDPNPLRMYYRPVDKHLPFNLIHGGGGEPRTRFICGYLGCDARPFNPLLGALPSIIHVRRSNDGTTPVTDLFRMTLAEGREKRPGSETMLAKLSELMFVEVVRSHLAALPQESKGWLAGLRDRNVGAALLLLHGRPAEPWTLDRLARESGVSRTILAERFAHHLGISPMQYLTHWRMQLAARQMENPDVSIAQAAAEVGYESEAAFNRAFKKVVGIPPGAWRRGRRGEALGPAKAFVDLYQRDL
jgi:AraC-like DNA-binding protein